MQTHMEATGARMMAMALDNLEHVTAMSVAFCAIAIRGLARKVTDRPIGLKEHRAPAPGLGRFYF